MTPVFGLCEDYVTRWAALDPVAAELHGITAAFGAGTDYGPDGVAARRAAPDPRRGGPLLRLAGAGHLVQAR